MSDLIETIVGIVIVVAVGVFLIKLVEDSPEVVYEYETTSGETGEATHCNVYKNTYCVLEDGTRVVNIKKYKRVEK